MDPTKRLLELCEKCNDRTLAAVFRKCAQGLADKKEYDNAMVLVSLILAECNQ